MEKDKEKKEKKEETKKNDVDQKASIEDSLSRGSIIGE